MLWVIAYDIADDRRRETVSAALCAWGARVQLSVFECEFPDEATARRVVAEVAELIDETDDQVRVYRLWRDEANAIQILGRRRLEEREDFWII
jgi:CRISPR-associated protein Cas2